MFPISAKFFRLTTTNVREVSGTNAVEKERVYIKSFYADNYLWIFITQQWHSEVWSLCIQISWYKNIYLLTYYCFGVSGTTAAALLSLAARRRLLTGGRGRFVPAPFPPSWFRVAACVSSVAIVVAMSGSVLDFTVWRRPAVPSESSPAPTFPLLMTILGSSRRCCRTAKDVELLVCPVRKKPKHHLVSK